MQKAVLAIAVFAALAAPSLARAGDVAMRVQEVPLGARVARGGRARAALQHARRALDRHRDGHLPHAQRCTAAGSAGAADATSDRPSTGAWHDGNLDWTGASDARPVPRPAATSAACARTSCGRASSARPPALSQAGSPAIVTRPAGTPTRRSCARSRHRAGAEARRRSPHGRHELVHACAGARRSCAGSRSTTCRETAGTTSATTFSSTASARSTRAAAAAIERNVIGAHAEGFNTGTVGVALIGNFTAASPPQAQQDALVGLLAWRLDVAHVDPLSTVVYTSGGNAKFRAGQGRDAARHLRPSRHRPERMPRQACVRAAARRSRSASRDGPAEALRADGRRRARRPDPLPGAALVRRCRGR